MFVVGLLIGILAGYRAVVDEIHRGIVHCLHAATGPALHGRFYLVELALTNQVLASEDRRQVELHAGDEDRPVRVELDVTSRVADPPQLDSAQRLVHLSTLALVQAAAANRGQDLALGLAADHHAELAAGGALERIADLSPAELDLAWLRDRHPDAQSENAEPAKRNSRRRGRGGRSRDTSEVLIAEGELEPPSPSLETEAEAESGSEQDKETSKPLAVAVPAVSDLAARAPGEPPSGPASATVESPETSKSTNPAESEPDPVEESTETAQTVDSEAESRIIPRSE